MYTPNFLFLDFTYLFFFLAQNIGPMKKRLKTTDINQDENKDEENPNVNKNNDSNRGELFKHIKESKDGDAETLDAATNVNF